MAGALRIVGRWAAALGALGCAAVAAAGQGGRWSPVLDIFNHFAPFGLLASGLCGALAAWLWRGWPRWAIMALMVGVLLTAGPQVLPEWLARLAPGAAAEGERLKLVQFNAYAFNVAPARSVDWLLAQKADLVVIEEGEGLPAAQLARLRQGYPHCNGCYGIASHLILSRRPSLAQGQFGDGQPINEIPTSGGWSRFAGPGGDYMVVAVHLAWPWHPSSDAQQAALAQFVARQPQVRTLVAGDFNMAPWSFGLRRFDRALGLPRLTHGQASWPAQAYHRAPTLTALPFPYLPIDQVYAGPGWARISVRRGPRLGSDHYPIVVELAARPARPRP